MGRGDYLLRLNLRLVFFHPLRHHSRLLNRQLELEVKLVRLLDASLARTELTVGGLSILSNFF